MEHRIRERAYFIWEKTGSLDELANWLEAERQLCEEEARIKDREHKEHKKTKAPPAKAGSPAPKVAAPLKAALKKAGLGTKAKKK